MLGLDPLRAHEAHAVNWAGVARCRWRLLRNSLIAGGARRSRQRPLLGAALAIILGALICVALAGFFGQLATQGAGAAEAADGLALVLNAALVGLLVFDLHEAVSALVADSDLELLRRAPVPGSALFFIKLADAFPRTSLLVVVLVIPAVVAYHVFFPIPPWAWALLPLQLLALWAIPLGIGIATAMMLLRVVPARRAREALGLLSTITLFVLWLVNSFLVPRLAETGGDPLVSLRTGIRSVAAALHWSPGAWAANALAASATAEAEAIARWNLMLLVAAGVVLAAAAWVAARHLESTQAAIEVGAARRSKSARSRRLALAGAGPRGRRGEMSGSEERPTGLVRAILVRDGRLFFRDWTLLGDVVTAAILWTLLPLVGAPLYNAAPPAMGRAMLVALTVGLGYEVAARALPFERHGWAWMRLAPARPSRWIVAKMLGAAAISLPLVLLASLSMALTLGLGGRAILEAYAIVFPALLLSLTLGLWTGAVFGNPGWNSPRGMLTPTGRVVATLLLMLQAGAWLGSAFLLDHGVPLPREIALVLPSLGAALLALLPLRATARLMGEREWRG